MLLVALALSVLGPVQQDPVAVAVSAAVAVGVSVLAGRACGALWRTRVHTESAVITGLILALLFWPETTPAGLGVVALAAALAALSKFVVAVRARHVLNPAAAGALAAGLLAPVFGGFGATWWVATPALLPVVAVAALVVVLRTRRFALVATYLAVALAVLLPRLVAAGAAPLDALLTALQSYPLVFAAGFMLTEPLTLPPRRWQQLSEAALVGALTVVPFSLGVLYASPELALVVGNVLAFTVGQRRAVHLRVRAQRMVTPGIREVAFASDAAVRFRPGQWIELHVPHTECRRARVAPRVLAGHPARPRRRGRRRVPGDRDPQLVQAGAQRAARGWPRARDRRRRRLRPPQGPDGPAAAGRGRHRHHPVREPAGRPRPVGCAAGRRRGPAARSGRRGSRTPTCSSTPGRAWSS